MLGTVVLESVFVLEGLHANVAREARRVVIVDGEVLSKSRWQREALCADRALVGLVVVIHLMIFKSIFAFETLVAFLALVDFLVVHDLVLLETNQSWEDLVTDVADLGGSGSVLVLVIFKTILAFEFLVALKRQN